MKTFKKIINIMFLHKRYFLLVFLLFNVLLSKAISFEDGASVFESIKFMPKEEKITVENTKKFPFGIAKTINNVNVELAVSKVSQCHSYISLDVYAKVKFRETILMFGAQDLHLSYDGGFVGETTLSLLESVEIPMKKNQYRLIIYGGMDENMKSDSPSYIKIKCDGTIEDIGLSMGVEFPQDFIYPVDKQNKRINNEKVSTSFFAKMSSFDDLIIGVDLPRFAINGLDDFAFECRNIIFDFSDLRNSENMVFPANYFTCPEIENWQGFFVQNISVFLPSQFKDTSRKEPISFEANNMIIDEDGLSGIFIANTPILSIENGSASGWGFSVDRFRFKFEKNKFSEGGFGGKILLPVSENKKNALDYEGVFSLGSRYSLLVSNKDTLSFDVFKAKTMLYPESYVELKVENKEFKPEACLHGKMSIDTGSKDGSHSDAVMPGIKFQTLKLKTEHPYISVDTFGYVGGATMAKLPINIKHIYIRIPENSERVALNTSVDVTFGDAIKGGTEFTLFGKRAVVDNHTKWSYDGFLLNNIRIDANFAGTFSIKGEIFQKKNDPIYGDCFGGSMTLGFEKVLKGLSVDAQAIFGNDGFDYWEVDGNVQLGTGIPCGPITLFGFSGGASKSMKREGSALSSNAKYVPDKSLGLGLRAGLLVGFISKELITAKLMLEIQFNKHKGLNFIALYGQADIMAGLSEVEGLADKASQYMGKIEQAESKIAGDSGLSKLMEKRANNPQSECKELLNNANNDEKVKGCRADLIMQYSFEEKTFHAQLDTRVNYVEILTGAYANYNAGQAVMHLFDSSDWYLYLGKPDQPISLKLGFEKIGTVSLSSYLMAGSELPASPNPPSQVTEILGHDLNQLDYVASLNTLKNGGGFAFGANLSVDTGDLSFLIAYARFQAGIGFDIMLSNLEDATCKGQDGPIGLKGWFSKGQVYAYLAGELGIEVNLIFVKGRFPVIKAGTAALLESTLPHPTWMFGCLGVDYNILNGLIKGKMNFKFELGEECVLINPGASPLETPIISEVFPSGNEVDVFSEPQVAFSIPINKPFVIDLDGKKKVFKAKIDKFSVMDSKNMALEGDTIWNREKDKLTLHTKEIMNPKEKYTIETHVGFYEMVKGNWTDYRPGGVKSTETSSIEFITGNIPDSIPFDHISYMYPLVNQNNFHPKEYDKGFIQLDKGMASVFSNAKCYVRYHDQEGALIEEMSMNYDGSNNQLQFNIPSDLPLSTNYKFNIVAVSKEQSKTNSASYNQVNIEDEAELEVKQAHADNLVNDEIEKVILSYDFRTSKYATFVERMADANTKKIRSMYKSPITGVYLLYSETSSIEPFDEYELLGNKYTQGKSIISMSSNGLDDFYKVYMKPLYEAYGRKNPPFDHVYLDKNYLRAYSENNSSYTTTVFPLVYELDLQYYYDVPEMRSWAYNRYASGDRSGNVMNLLDISRIPIKQGKYPIVFQYRLPNGTISSNKARFEFDNKISFK